jgi:hypothetical protein
MSLTLNFRVVGLYLEFADLEFADLEPTSTVEQIMTKLNGARGFTFLPGTLRLGQPDEKKIVVSMTYEYTPASTKPENSSAIPLSGPRTLENRFTPVSDVNRVWQYYRGAKVKIGENEVDIEFPTSGQPSFTTLSLNAGNTLPANIPIISYSLTWRLVTIDKLPEQRLLEMESALRRAVAGR